MGSKRKELTPKELKFVLAFTEIGTDTCGRQGKSAIAAGWSEEEANKQATRLLKRTPIRNAIQKIHKRLMDAAMINPQKILADLENTKNLALAKADLVSANRSIHLQGQYLAMFKDVYTVEDSPPPEPMSPEKQAFYRKLAHEATMFDMEENRKKDLVEKEATEKLHNEIRTQGIVKMRRTDLNNN